MANMKSSYIDIASIEIKRAIEENKDDIRGKKLRVSIKEILIKVAQEAKSTQSDNVKRLTLEVEKFMQVKKLLR